MTLTPARSMLLGIVLFLFIPAVLTLFVVHPEPIAASLAAGAVLMVGHRALAHPYFRAARPATCVWCHRTFGAGRPGRHALDLAVGAGNATLLACEQHVDRTRRFFAFLDHLRWPLRVGIGLPLLLLLAALVAASFGSREALAPATEAFRLAVGITVQVAALGPFLGEPTSAARAAFPVHNFYLLGIRAILWIFRLVGAWWIFSAGRYWLSL